MQTQLADASKEVEALQGELAALRDGFDTVKTADETEDETTATPKRKKMLSKIKSSFTPRRFKKKRKLFKKGASFNDMLDGADGADGDEATQSRAVDHLVTPQKKVHKGKVRRRCP